jgi:tetratricopeptide (TPR) repeat protein
VDADSALRLDPQSPDGWAARGLGLAARQPQVPADAQDALRRAANLDSANVAVLQIRGLLLQRAGDDSGAAGIWRRILTVDPHNAAALYTLALEALDARRYEAARGWLDSATILNPTPTALATRARVRLASGDLSGARQDAEAARRRNEGDVMPGEATLALTDIQDGDTTQARRRTVKLLRLALADSAITAREAFWLATMLTTLGAPSRALDVLEVARPAGAALWLELRAPELDPLRWDPRFLQLEEATRPRPAT